MDHSLFWNFLLAIALGALIGTEREMPWSGTKTGGASGFGGIRSYALLALLGALAAWMDIVSNTGNLWKGSGFVISSALVIAGYIYSSFYQHRMGVTSEFAALLTYFIGVIVMDNYHIVAVILSIFMLILLSSKEFFSRMQERFSRVELGHSLKFSVISIVTLTLLPDQKYSLLEMANWFGIGATWVDPIITMPFFNPYSIWFFVVIMTGVEYVGYILSKVLGKNGGIVASGAVGGMISSTATTAAMTRKSQDHPSNRHVYATATLIASCIMFIRVLVISGYYSPAILSTILLPASIMLISLSGSAYYNYLQSKKERVVQTEEKDTYESPFRILPALQFALIVVAIKFIAGAGLIYKTDLRTLLGEHADKFFYYILGALSGLADVDAITYEMSLKASEKALPLVIASSTILIAVMSNNIVKASIAGRFGEKRFGQLVMMGFGLSISCGLVVIVFMNMIFT